MGFNNIVMLEKKSGDVYPGIDELSKEYFFDLDLDDPDLTGIIVATEKSRVYLEIKDSGMILTDEHMMALSEIDEEVERRRSSFKIVNGKK